MPLVLRNYTPVTEARLQKPDDGDWMMNRRTYDGWGYSPLTQITPANVGRLKPVWSFSTGAINGHEAAPIVHDGVMFVATPGSQVIAIEAATGTVLWRYRRPLAPTVINRHPTTRGVGLLGDKVFLAASDAVLMALDARTGRTVWTTTVADNRSGHYMSLAPLVANGKVLVGTSGGELGIRGFIAAYDPDTGKELWRTYTVPAPGEPGSESWPKGGDQWKTGGGSVWVTANYDPETNLAYWGTGNGGPWMGDQRPGDNLYTSSTIAIDVATGKIKGHFQYTPNESFDWDEVSPPILVDFQRNGRTIKGLVDVARDGYMRVAYRRSCQTSRSTCPAGAPAFAPRASAGEPTVIDAGVCACRSGAMYFASRFPSLNSASARRVASSSLAPPATSSRQRSSRCWASSSTISCSRAGERRRDDKRGRTCSVQLRMFISGHASHSRDKRVPRLPLLGEDALALGR